MQDISKKLKSITKEQYYSWLLGISLVTLVIHNPNQPLINIKLLFLPAISLLVILFISFDMLVTIIKAKQIDLGSKWLYIPLTIITISILLNPGSLINIPIALGLFSLYLTSRKLGNEIFKPMTAATIIISLSCIYGYFVTDGKNGGIISPTNYDIATGALVFFLIVSSLKSQWWLSAIALTGLFFTGSEEGIFATAVLFIAILIRRDFSKKLLLPVTTLILLLVIFTPLGITHNLYFPTEQKIAALKEVVEETPIAKAAALIIPDSITNRIETAKPDITEYEGISKKDAYLDKATGLRWLSYWNLSPIKPLGYGFNMFNFYKGIPHNVPMIIIEQTGLLAAIAWSIVVLYGLIRTRYKYAWLAFVALGIFDHFTWTMAAPWFWALAGASSSNKIANDYIFKKEKYYE